jgi:hypothetical protein
MYNAYAFNRFVLDSVYPIEFNKTIYIVLETSTVY